MSGIVLTVEVRIRPEARQVFLETVVELRDLSIKEDGVFSYGFYEDPTEAGVFFFHELYRDTKALAAHQDEVYCRSYVERLPGWLAGPATVQIHELTGVDQFVIAAN